MADEQEMFFQNIVRQHVFHPLSRFKPAPGSMLLSEQKESLLHCFTLIDDLGVSLTNSVEKWQEIEQQQYDRLKPNSLDPISKEFCNIRPFPNVSQYSNEELISEFSKIEEEVLQSRLEYQHKLDDINADPLNIVDPKLLKNPELDEHNLVEAYYATLIEILSKTRSYTSSFPFLRPIEVSTDKLSEQMIDLTPPGTIFEKDDVNYVLEPVFYSIDNSLPKSIYFLISEEFLRLIGNYAVYQTEEETLDYFNINTAKYYSISREYETAAYNDLLCYYNQSFVVNNRTIECEEENVQNVEVYEHQGITYIAFTSKHFLFLSANYEKFEPLKECTNYEFDNEFLLLCQEKTTALFNIVTGEWSEIRQPISQSNNYVYLLRDLPAFYFEDELYSTFNGFPRGVRHENGKIYTFQPQKINVFNEKEKSPLFEICPRINEVFKDFKVFNDYLYLLTESCITVWRISQTPEEIGEVEGHFCLPNSKPAYFLASVEIGKGVMRIGAEDNGKSNCESNE